MFGLEKKQRAPFEFDLEKELKKDPAKARELLKHVEAKLQEVKGVLRTGADAKDFDTYGAILQGYAALQKVLTIMINKR